MDVPQWGCECSQAAVTICMPDVALLIENTIAVPSGINMPGSPVVDIQNSFGAAFIGLLASTA